MRRNKKAVTLDWTSANKVVDATKRIIFNPRNEVPDDSPPLTWGGITVLKVTTALTPASAGTPGMGKGKIQKLVSGVFSDLVGSSPPTYTVLNMLDKTVALNAYIAVNHSYGAFIYGDGKCADLS